MGRVAVQVKGRERRDDKGPIKSYPIPAIDLQAYMNDGGVIFFVVAIGKTSRRTIPSYRILSPFVIRDILETAKKNSKTVSVEFYELSEDVAHLQRLVEFALHTGKQNPDMLRPDEGLFKAVKSLSVHTTQRLDWSAPLTLNPAKSEVALSLNTEDGRSIPLDGVLELIPEDYMGRRRNLGVSSGSVKYEEVLVKRLDAETVQVCLGEGGVKLQLRDGSKGRTGELSLTMTKFLPTRLKDIAFFLNAADNGVIEIGSSTFGLKVERAITEHPLSKQYTMLKSIQELFDTLDVDSNLIALDEITDEQYIRLRMLHRGLVLKQPIVSATGEPGWAMEPMGDWLLMVLLTRGDEADTWIITDPFSVQDRWQVLWRPENDQDPVPVTPYDVIESDLDRVLNLRLGAVVDAYRAIADGSNTYGLANECVLDLIRAADCNGQRATEFLGAAAELCDWLKVEQGPCPEYLLNRGQIDWRQQKLSAEQRAEIRQLKRDMTRSDESQSRQFEVACALVLGEADEASYLIDKLTEEQLEHMRKWPIWYLREALQDENARAIESPVGGCEPVNP